MNETKKICNAPEIGHRKDNCQVCGCTLSFGKHVFRRGKPHKPVVGLSQAEKDRENEKILKGE